jgi:hypothetical protein
MQCGKKIALASAVLELNLHVFPGHTDSSIFLARLHLQENDRTRATAVLQKALEQDPANTALIELLEKTQ